MTVFKKRSPGWKKRLASAFFISAIFIFAAPALQAAKNSARGGIENPGKVEIARVYDTVPREKSLLTSPQFRVIDDFGSKDMKNRLGAAWKLSNAKAGDVSVLLTREDARGMKPGHSIKINFTLNERQQLSFFSSLESLDMSQAHFLALKCRVTPAPKNKFEGRIRVSLADWTGKSVTRDITDKCEAPKEKWGEAILPIEYFKGLDFDQLSKITFTVMNRDGKTQAAFWLDEIAFFGHNEMGFESTLDNIKGFPKVVLDYPAKEALLKANKDRDFIDKIGRSTWRYFEEAVDNKNDLPLDHVKVGDFPMAGVYTSPTNIAMDLMGSVAACELGYLSKSAAEERVGRLLSTVNKLPKWKGFFFNFYGTNKLSVSRKFVSSIDNAWLAAAMIVLRQAFPGHIAREATAILDGFNFGEFLDPETNHLAIGYDADRDSFTPYHYGMLVTEARVMSLIGIGKGDLPVQHWWYLFRTAPDAWDWQSQKPEGKWVKRDGVEYFQGYYKDGNKKFVPSWGGSLFEFLMPSIVVPEYKLAPKSLGANNKIATELHMEYALTEKKYPVWGISPAAVTAGRKWSYGEYGVPKLGAKGYAEKAVIAPYVSFLALETLPQAAVKNLRKMLELYDIYGEYGFYDSVNVLHQRVTQQYLALDQGMSFLAIANYLKNGAIQNLFMKDPITKKAKSVLEKEGFF